MSKRNIVMNKIQLISRILIVIICLVLIVYIGMCTKFSFIKTWTISLNCKIISLCEVSYTPVAKYYTSEKKNINETIYQCAMNVLAANGYYTQGKDMELAIDDEETKKRILALQEMDENAVDEKGNVTIVNEAKEESPKTVSQKSEVIDQERLNDFEYIKSHFYTIDRTTSISKSELNASEFLEKDMRIQMDGEAPKVLIYHTHSQEAFQDSVKGDESTSIVGMGNYLSELLVKKGIPVLHYKGVFDLIDGRLDRSQAYELAKPKITKLLKENPSIEVIIDLHRDGVAETTHLVTDINGKKTAKIMFFNGLSRTNSNGNIGCLSNPYIQDNLAFSFQMEMKARELYPDFTRKIYLKSYRYNMHFLPKTLLIEAGAQTNTVEEERNAMEPLAEILSAVLKP